MRRMLESIAPVLLVAVTTGDFVVMSALPATAEPASDRLDHLHAARPIAAHTNFVPPEYIPPSGPPHLTEAEMAWIEGKVAAKEAANQRGAQVASAHSSCNGDVDCFLACTRAHESDSSGGYAAVSSGGQYRGAYQFSQPTWDAAVAGAGHGEYAGAPADEVPAEVQDAAAAHLYSVSGTRPWNGRC
jgi:Transglycosylase-like domain